MDLLPCPHCDMLVSIADDGICPSCRKSVDHPPDEVRTTNSGLTLAEQFYTAFVILCALVVAMSMAVFHFMVIPKADDPTIFYFVVTIGWIAFCTLGITVACNLWKRSLLVIPTVVQVILLCLLVYFSPIGIWGGCLLYFRLRRQASST